MTPPPLTPPPPPQRAQALRALPAPGPGLWQPGAAAGLGQGAPGGGGGHRAARGAVRRRAAAQRGHGLLHGEAGGGVQPAAEEGGGGGRVGGGRRCTRRRQPVATSGSWLCRAARAPPRARFCPTIPLSRPAALHEVDQRQFGAVCGLGSWLTTAKSNLARCPTKGASSASDTVCMGRLQAAPARPALHPLQTCRGTCVQPVGGQQHQPVEAKLSSLLLSTYP